MSLPLTGTCSGCGTENADFLVFNDRGNFCVDCDTTGVAYGEKRQALRPYDPTNPPAAVPGEIACTVCGCAVKYDFGSQSWYHHRGTTGDGDHAAASDADPDSLRKAKAPKRISGGATDETSTSPSPRKRAGGDPSNGVRIIPSASLGGLEHGQFVIVEAGSKRRVEKVLHPTRESAEATIAREGWTVKGKPAPAGPSKADVAKAVRRLKRELESPEMAAAITAPLAKPAPKPSGRKLSAQQRAQRRLAK